MNEFATQAMRHAKRVVVVVIGTTLLALGLLLIVTPGPGVVVLGLGLGVLGVEFAWARHWLATAREQFSRGRERLRGRRGPRGDEDVDGPGGLAG